MLAGGLELAGSLGCLADLLVGALSLLFVVEIVEDKQNEPNTLHIPQ